MIATFALAAAARDCPAPVVVDTWRQRVAEVDALASPETRHEAVPAVLAAVPCLGGPVAPSDAAALHRLVSIDARWAGDSVRAMAAAAAAARIDPAGVDPAVALHPELRVPVDAMATMGAVFGTSLAVRVFVDGVEEPTRTVGQPAVIQVFDGAGNAVEGAWVPGDVPLPDWVAFPDLRCDGATPVDELLRRVTSAESAYTALDVPSFERSLEAVARGLPCVSAPVGGTQAAAIHRLEGLRQFAHGADEAALRSFQEARALEPLYEPSADLVRPETTLAALWTRAADPPPGTWIAERVPDGLFLEVDGQPSTARPTAVPTIVQLADVTGAVWWTRYVPPNTRLPDLEPVGVAAADARLGALSPARALYAEMGARRSASVKRTALFVGSAGAYTLSGAAFVAHTTAFGQYMDRTTPQPELDRLRGRANTAATLSSVAFVAGSSALVGAFFVR